MLAGPLWTQDQPPLTTFRSESDLVVLNVSVFDKDGKIIKGLPKSDFTVQENGENQEIKVFRQEDVPISLGLVIDDSASMKEKRDRVNSAALAMVRASNPQDEVFVLNFNEDAQLAQDFTSDVTRLESSLRVSHPSGQTAMRDALVVGLDHLRAHAKNDKKALLIVTDGEDNISIESQQRLVEAAQRLDVIIYAIGLLGAEQPASARRARESLEELTRATGGRAWFPADVSEVERITPEIAHEIRNQYIVGYTPTNTAQDGTYRKIQVQVNVPGATVRTRSGYYARGGHPSGALRYNDVDARFSGVNRSSGGPVDRLRHGF
ncbi:MAG: VWA domain-containing protein [Candidatus Sulfopaludibacter sp.]|nr:VWA domain-containing protein [Candidatus Sulfopaludibacter sp.]